MEDISKDENQTAEKVELGLSEKEGSLIEVGSVQLKPKGEYTVGKGRLPPYTQTEARTTQFNEVQKRNAIRFAEKKLEKQRALEEKQALLEIEKHKTELRRRQILDEAEKLRHLIQTAVPVGISTNPNTLIPVETHVDIPEVEKTVIVPVSIKSETKMSKRLDIEEVPVEVVSIPPKRVTYDDTPVKRKVSDYEREDDVEEDEILDVRSHHIIPARAPAHTAYPNRMERHEDSRLHGAGNHSRSRAPPPTDDDEVDYEYMQILAEAKQRVADRRREATLQRVMEEEKYQETLRQQKLKAARPSEATRYLEHTQNQTHQQFTQKVVAKSEEGFIWM